MRLFIYIRCLHAICVSIMKFIEQPVSIDTINVDKYAAVNVKKNKRHGSLLPDSIRGLIVGPSNCGKTSALLSLILSENGLCFKNIYIYSKSLEQPKYKYLERVFSKLKDIGYHAYSNNSEIAGPSDAEPYSIAVFDDVSCEKQI